MTNPMLILLLSRKTKATIGSNNFMSNSRYSDVTFNSHHLVDNLKDPSQFYETGCHEITDLFYQVQYLKACHEHIFLYLLKN